MLICATEIDNCATLTQTCAICSFYFRPVKEPKLTFDDLPQLVSRCSIAMLSEVMKYCKSHESMKKSLIEMGFEHLLEWDFYELPSRLCYHVIDNFNPATRMLKVADSDVQLTPELVHSYLGLPRGTKKVKVLKVQTKSSLFIPFMRHFVDDNRIPVPIASLKPQDVFNVVKNYKNGGIWFRRCFIVLFFTLFVESIQNGGVNTKVLDALVDEDEICNLDWCSLLVEKTIENVEAWKKRSSPNGLFRGSPLLLLV